LSRLELLNKMINNFYDFLGIRKELTFEYQVDKLAFYKIFSSNVTDSSIHIKLPFESFTEKEKRYIGEVKFDRFQIRRKSSFTTNNSNFPYIFGKIKEVQKNVIKIDVEINGAKYFFFLGIIGYLLVVIWVLTYLAKFSDFFLIPFSVFIFFTCLFIFQIISTRYLVNQEIIDIERELSFHVSKANITSK